MTPERERFIDDLRLKSVSESTIKVYVNAVEKIARFLGRSPDESTAEDVREFLIHELNRSLSRSYCVIQQNALRHLYLDTLGRADELQAIPRPKRERRQTRRIHSSRRGGCTAEDAAGIGRGGSIMRTALEVADVFEQWRPLV